MGALTIGICDQCWNRVQKEHMNSDFIEMFNQGRKQARGKKVTTLTVQGKPGSYAELQHSEIYITASPVLICVLTTGSSNKVMCQREITRLYTWRGIRIQHKIGLKALHMVATQIQEYDWKSAVHVVTVAEEGYFSMSDNVADTDTRIPTTETEEKRLKWETSIHQKIQTMFMVRRNNMS